MEESSQPRERRGTKRPQSFVFARVTTSLCRRFCTDLLVAVLEEHIYCRWSNELAIDKFLANPLSVHLLANCAVDVSKAVIDSILSLAFVSCMPVPQTVE